jgi:hypothetical protein
VARVYFVQPFFQLKNVAWSSKKYFFKKFKMTFITRLKAKKCLLFWMVLYNMSTYLTCYTVWNFIIITDFDFVI